MLSLEVDGMTLPADINARNTHLDNIKLDETLFDSVSRPLCHFGMLLVHEMTHPSIVLIFSVSLQCRPQVDGCKQAIVRNHVQETCCESDQRKREVLGAGKRPNSSAG